METNNLYYNSKYCATVPIESYGDQFKDYLDSKLSGLANSDDFKDIEKNLTEKIDASDKHVISNVHQIVNDSTNKTICNIKNAVNDSTEETACNIQCAKNEIIETIQTVGEDLTTLETNINCSITQSADNVVKAVETIAGNIESNLSNAITVSADNVVKANEVIAGNIESNLSNYIDSTVEGLKTDLNESIDEATDNIVQATDSIVSESAEKLETNISEVVSSTSVKVENTVKNESTLVKEKIAKMREDLIAAINNSDSLTSVGFSDLNTSVIANKEDAVYRINRQANVNKQEVLNAIYGEDFEPYTVYGGTVYNIVHFGVQSLTENDVINLPSVMVNTYTPDVTFSIKVKDVAVIGMNDDATGEIYTSARTQNELNIVFAYPKKYEATEIFDSIDDNLTKSFEKKDIQINGVDYIVAMQPSKVVNLYDPQWETPLNYTLNYLLKIG